MELRYLVLFLLPFLISSITIPIIIYISRTLNIYDHIDDRKIHDSKLSRLGGVAIFLAFIIPFLTIVFPDHSSKFNIYIYLIALFIAFLTGFIDDIISIKARYKLIIQIISGILVAISGLTIQRLNLFGLFEMDFGIYSYPLTVLWVILFMNAINLIDGMDGLASGIVFIANIFILFIALSYNNSFIVQIGVIISGSILGFYLYNFPPAKIFMGDGGSYFLGFIYSTLPLMGIKESSVTSIFLIPLILLLIPISDMILIIFRRLKNRCNIFLADKNHVHHRLLNIGFSTRAILFVLYTLTTILGLISILMLYIKPIYSLILFSIIFLLILTYFYSLNITEKTIEALQKKANNIIGIQYIMESSRRSANEQSLAQIHKS